MSRILICDDHAVVRRGLRAILASQPDVGTIGEAATARELLCLARDGARDVVLLDPSLPDQSGLEALKQLKSERPDVPVLVLSVHPEDQFAIRCLKAGAAGYVNKDASETELVRAIRRAAAGRRYLSEALAETLAQKLEQPADRPLHETLSHREYAVLLSLAAGQRTTEIARELGLSVKTVSTYRSRILEKLGLRNNAEIVRYVLEHRLAG
jgi:DNA-binding NarL/FixJ family response regulator